MRGAPYFGSEYDLSPNATVQYFPKMRDDRRSGLTFPEGARKLPVKEELSGLGKRGAGDFASQFGPPLTRRGKTLQGVADPEAKEEFSSGWRINR